MRNESDAEIVERVWRYQASEAVKRREAAAKRETAAAAVGPRSTVDIGVAPALVSTRLTALCCLACGYFWTAGGEGFRRPNFCPGCGLEIGGFER